MRGSQQGTAIVPVSIPGFRFPDVHYINVVWPRMLGSELSKEIAHAQQFFHLIAVQLDTHSSDSVITAQAQAVLTRLPRDATAGRMSGVEAEESIALRKERVASVRRLSASEKEEGNENNIGGCEEIPWEEGLYVQATAPMFRELV